MELVREAFGRTEDGREAVLYTMKNSRGMEVSVTDYGAALVRIIVPDRDGKPVDCVLGYDDVEGYVHNHGSIGCAVGRNANRIGGAKVTIGGKVYELEKNDGENNLHSGGVRSAKFYYQAAGKKDDSRASVAFSRIMPDMEQGFPGALDMTITYTLTEDCELIIDYDASCDTDTVVNFTNHSYFNLSGQGRGDILDHIVTIDADYYTAAEQGIPTGKLTDVSGTPMDFRNPKAIGAEIDADYAPLKACGGYDHNYVLKTGDGKVHVVGSCMSPATGIRMEIRTDLPGMQVYTANFLGTVEGKKGAVYHDRDGVCFETQYFPNACNEPKFKSSILPGGEMYHTETVYAFSAE